ncbi:MAG: M15 family metallopeptidase [Verrucomicrobiota bacterium]
MSRFSLFSPGKGGLLVPVAPLLCLAIAIGHVVAEKDGDPADFVEITSLDDTILIELAYATRDNFCNEVLYDSDRGFLRREVARKLVAANQSLAPMGLGLKVWDGYRPQSVQRRMWELSPSPGYVANPKYGSKHNRGAAVDLTLYSLATGVELEMPTEYDAFVPAAGANALLSDTQVVKHREALQNAMRAQGFTTIQSEWWHFNYSGWRRFPLEDRKLSELAAEADAD